MSGVGSPQNPQAHLRVQVVAPVLRHSQLAIGQTHVVQVSPKAVIGPRPHHVPTGLVEVLGGTGRPWWRERGEERLVGRSWDGGSEGGRERGVQEAAGRCTNVLSYANDHVLFLR